MQGSHPKAKRLSIRWLLRDVTKQLWFTVALYCLLGVVTALSALVLAPLIPKTVSSQIGADAVDRILGILAASLLAVATFSISTMVQAFASASTSGTPRATQLVVEDRTAQRALATFIGAFVFSLVSLIALSTGAYGRSGRLVLFVVTIVVTILIIVMLLRWIDRLSRLGRVGETIDQVERATLAAIHERWAELYLGGRAAVPVPAGAQSVFSTEVGYLARIDVARLEKVADLGGFSIHVAILPGAFVTRDRVCAFIDGKPSAEQRAAIAGCFLVGDQRSYEQDPRFGMIVLSEIASRALSPAVNDPGTAIDVIGTLVRLLTIWGERTAVAEHEILYPRLFVPPLLSDELVEDGFAPIARDGAGMVEVQMRLQKGLRALSRLAGADLAAPARAQAHDALIRAEQAMTFDGDKRRLREAADWLADGREAPRVTM